MIPSTTFDSVHASISIIVQEADMESEEQLPTQVEVIISEEQTQ